MWEYQTPRDLVKAAKDWPQLNFIIYHGCFRALLRQTGRGPWPTLKTPAGSSGVPTLPRFRPKTGASNVYAEMGTTFASTAIVNPRLTAAILGTWIKGMGSTNVVWGTDSVFHGSPQWQIEALRRLEIPEDMQEKYGFAPLGPADGMVKNQYTWA